MKKILSRVLLISLTMAPIVASTAKAAQDGCNAAQVRAEQSPVHVYLSDKPFFGPVGRWIGNHPYISMLLGISAGTLIGVASMKAYQHYNNDEEDFSQISS